MSWTTPAPTSEAHLTGTGPFQWLLPEALGLLAKGDSPAHSLVTFHHQAKALLFGWAFDAYADI